MKIEQQVCSLELAKRLKELGVKQESLFHWQHKLGGSSESDAGKDILVYGRYGYHCVEVASAFTSAELGEMLPPGPTEHVKVAKSVDYPDLWMCWMRGHVERDVNEADARAKMLVWLIENNLITPSN